MRIYRGFFRLRRSHEVLIYQISRRISLWTSTNAPTDRKGRWNDSRGSIKVTVRKDAKLLVIFQNDEKISNQDQPRKPVRHDTKSGNSRTWTSVTTLNYEMARLNDPARLIKHLSNLPQIPLCLRALVWNDAKLY